MTSAPKQVINYYRISLALVFLLGTQSILNAQIVTPSVLNTNGFTKKLENGFVSLSIGESAVTTLHGLTGIITQGFLQPEIKPPCSDFKLDYFPNPVEDLITIRDSACGRIIDRIEVYDLLGNSILEASLVNREADLRLLGIGIFIVQGYSVSGEVLGTFKIVKIRDQ